MDGKEREKEKELRLVYQQYTTNRSEWQAYQDISRSPVGWKYIYSNSSSYTAILFLFLYLDQDRNVYPARLGCTTFFLKSIFANLYGVWLNSVREIQFLTTFFGKKKERMRRGKLSGRKDVRRSWSSSIRNRATIRASSFCDASSNFSIRPKFSIWWTADRDSGK